MDKLAVYLDLLLRWNARTNLTAVRDPEEIVSRHFGESLFAAQYTPASGTLLDFGSGAGFPGVPIALAHPGLKVTLAESQHKKAAFLREVVRVLGLSAEVWPHRVEAIPPRSVFDYVTLRAVDNMASAILSATPRASSAMLVMTTEGSRGDLPLRQEFSSLRVVPVPSSDRRILAVYSRR